MELANYPNISATACLVASWQANKGEASRDLPSEKKVYVKTIINRLRIVGCFDSGSDLSIMHASLYCNIFGSVKSLEKSPILDVRSFSNDSIKILGTKQVSLKFQESHRGIPTTI